MQPQTNSPLNNIAPIKRWLWLAAGVVVLLILLSIGNAVRNSRGFHVSSTNPKMSDVSSLSPYIVFAFNRDVSPKGVSVTSSPTNFISGTKVNGKNLQVNFKFHGMSPNKKYSITIKSISSTDGKKIVDKTFSFTAQEIGYDDLDPAAQQAIVNNQDHFTYTVDTYAFDGISVITDDAGLSSQQEQALRQAVFNYSKQLNTQFKLVTLYKESLQEGPDNPTTGGGTIYFTLGIDGKTYSAQMDHWELTVMHLYLRDPQTNAIVFDSGDIDGLNLE